MLNNIKDKIIIKDFKIAKILKKDITKRIIACFNHEPKTASQIANSISFPKEKIYYHIKQLISFDILFIAKREIVNGIEQKQFFPTAKEFITNEKNLSTQQPQLLTKITTTQHDNYIIGKTTPDITPKDVRSLNERRRHKDRRTNFRRDKNLNRRNKQTKIKGQNKRKSNDRRINLEQRNSSNRRQLKDQRFIPKTIYKNKKIKKSNPQKNGVHPQTILYKNALLKLNGVNEAITFIHSGNKVTLLHCTLKWNGFQIQTINTYEMPVIIKNHKIKNLTDLIINIFYQFFDPKERKKIYLAIQSDTYQCEMTYVNIPGKSQKLFKKNLIKNLSESYRIDIGNTFFDYVRNNFDSKKATVSFTKQKNKIENDFNLLTKLEETSGSFPLLKGIAQRT